jgi:hypothetical protein
MPRKDMKKKGMKISEPKKAGYKAKPKKGKK